MSRAKYLFPLFFLLAGPVSGAQDQPDEDEAGGPRPAIFHTRDERREARLGVQLTDWLKVSGQLEFESTSEDMFFPGGALAEEHHRIEGSAELAFDMKFGGDLSAELVLEKEQHSRESLVDEAMISYEPGNFEVTVGRLYVPFGTYYSHFVTGPLLEFGETRGNSLLLGYDMDDMVEIELFAFKGDAHEISTSEKTLDWGASIESKLLNGRVQLGVSYLSDLADAEERLLADNNNLYQKRVGAWSAFAIAHLGKWDIVIETMRADKKFMELDSTEDQPRSTNLELAYFINNNWEVALRYETSDELADEPERQYGLTVNWRVHLNVSLGIEYLRGDFKPGFVFDDNDNELSHREIFSTKLIMEF